MWNFKGQSRPDFAVEPGPGQESVWDYPRPPALVPDYRPVEVLNGDELLARSSRAMRVLETASPPTFYLPPEDIAMDKLARARGSSYCEWKGVAQYWVVVNSTRQQPVAWSYADPTPAFIAIKDWLCFYPSGVECYVDGERVRAQQSDFYGGWVTDDIVGPFKGEAGTRHW